MQPWEQFSQTSMNIAKQPWEQFGSASQSDGSSGLGNVLAKRGVETLNAVANSRTPQEAALNVMGKGVAGAVGDVMGAGISAVTPDFIKQGLATGAQSTANAIDSTSIGQSAGDTLLATRDNLNSLMKKNPRTANALESVGNIAAIVPASEFAQPILDAAKSASNIVGGIASKAGTAIADSADARMAANKASFVQDLITPKLTPTVKADQFSRSTEQGLFNKRVVQPSPHEAAIANTVSQLPVSQNKSLLANYNIISDANDAKAIDLQSKLQNANVPIKLGELNYTLDNAMDALRQNPWVSGDGEKSAQSVMNGFKDIVIKNNDLSAAGLLQARKDFDRWVQNQKGSGVFDPSRDTPITKAIQTVRQSVNDLIAAKVPQADVKTSLAEQSHLYRAMDNIETKGGMEAPNAISRMAQKASAIIPVKGAIAKTAVATGALGTAAYAPAIAGGLGTAYVAGKLATSPTVQKGIGVAMNSAGQLMQGNLAAIMKMPPVQAKAALAKFKSRP